MHDLQYRCYCKSRIERHQLVPWGTGHVKAFSGASLNGYLPTRCISNQMWYVCDQERMKMGGGKSV